MLDGSFKLLYRSEMISEALRLFRLRAHVYHNAKVCGDWRIHESEEGQTCFHMPTEGGCYLQLPGGPKEVLEEGELVFFPREIKHCMCPLEAFEGAQAHLPFSEAKDKHGTGMLCGKVSFDMSGGKTLVNAMPKMLVIRHSESTQWLRGLQKLLIEESYREPNSLVIDRLSELLVMYSLRHFAEHHCNQGAVLSLYGHPKISVALNAFHAAPAQVWTIEGLASCCGMSRTSFAEAFRQTSAWTPKQYITWWRMQRAYVLIQQGEQLAQVAERVGYQSEAAFSRAFQKEFKQTITQVRREKASNKKIR
ncbi:MAG: AraC family transcriptional regulator [Agarilytica sp.]